MGRLAEEFVEPHGRLHNADHLRITCTRCFIPLFDARGCAIVDVNVTCSIMSKTGDKNGVRWSRSKRRRFVKPLTAILTLNTIAHTMGAAGVGAEVSRIWGDDSLTVASIILTLAVLFLSEIIPKTIGAAYWKKLSLPSGFILSGMTKMRAPFFVPLLMFKRLLPKAESASVTRDELHALEDISEEEGELEEDEETVIHNLLALEKCQ